MVGVQGARVISIYPTQSYLNLSLEQTYMQRTPSEHDIQHSLASLLGYTVQGLSRCAATSSDCGNRTLRTSTSTVLRILSKSIWVGCGQSFVRSAIHLGQKVPGAFHVSLRLPSHSLLLTRCSLPGQRQS